MHGGVYGVRYDMYMGVYIEVSLGGIHGSVYRDKYEVYMEYMDGVSVHGVVMGCMYMGVLESAWVYILECAWDVYCM